MIGSSTGARSRPIFTCARWKPAICPSKRQREDSSVVEMERQFVRPPAGRVHTPGVRRLLPNQRALPDPEQQLFELGEMLRPQLGTPLAFDVPKDLVDFRVGGASAFGQADNSRAPLIG